MRHRQDTVLAARLLAARRLNAYGEAGVGALFALLQGGGAVGTVARGHVFGTQHEPAEMQVFL